MYLDRSKLQGMGKHYKCTDKLYGTPLEFQINGECKVKMSERSHWKHDHKQTVNVVPCTGDAFKGATVRVSDIPELCALLLDIFEASPTREQHK